MKLLKHIKGIAKSMFKEIFYLGWTLAGTGLVLITLSSSTLTYGIWISAAGLALHLVSIMFDYFDGEQNG